MSKKGVREGLVFGLTIFIFNVFIGWAILNQTVDMDSGQKKRPFIG